MSSYLGIARLRSEATGRLVCEGEDKVEGWDGCRGDENRRPGDSMMKTSYARDVEMLRGFMVVGPEWIRNA